MKFLDVEVPQIPVAAVSSRVGDLYGLEGDLVPLDSERDQTYLLDMAGDSYVLKISNRVEDPAVVDMQLAALRHLENVDPDLPVPRVVPTRDGSDLADIDGHMLRVLTYLPGRSMREASGDELSRLRRQLGALLARFDVAMRGFFHPAARHEHPWDLLRAAELRPFTGRISPAATRQAVETVLDRTADDVLPRLARMRQQVIHQDAHGDNVLIDGNDIVGLIDFGDMVHGPLMAELAVAADVAWVEGDPIDAMADLVAGYDSVLAIEPEEIDLLFDLVLARVAATITIGSVRSEADPEMMKYVDHYAVVLDDLAGRDRAQIARRLRDAARMPASAATADLEKRRATHLGPHTPHFYTEPLHVEAAEGPWLVGADGRRYLDFYNNVPQVGHSHPRVAAAIARQAATLNTNTRYLYTAVVDYATRLSGLLGDHLTRCLFVNSGSEANDVAVQMARVVSGSTGMVVMEHAYHGITSIIRELSPSKPDIGALPHVAQLEPPDTYRGPHRGSDAAARYAAATEPAIARLPDVAGFIVDSAMCSNGVLDVPDGYLAAVADVIRTAGGVVIADEVQSGLGRMGVWWGHELRGVRPDIVTLGKPVGNGHPLGVVVTTADIMDAFMSRTRLFSTFGGNPVSCAAGMAVLDVIEDEGLVANAARMGEYVRRGLRELADRHGGEIVIGDVRGAGLVVGVDLVTDSEARTPATAATSEIVERMRRHGVLVGSDGPDANVLKLRPPLIIDQSHVDAFIEALEASLF